MIGPPHLQGSDTPANINAMVDDLRAAVAEYKAAIAAATQKRDDAIRAARDKGMRPVDIEDETGYSRETVRQILMTEAEREAFRAKRRKGGDQ